MGISFGAGINMGPGIQLVRRPEPDATLILSLDATSYSGSGTTWPSLTGPNATLENIPGYSATSPTYFYFDNYSYDWAWVSNLGNLSNWSVETIFMFDDGGSATSLDSIVASVVGNQFDGSNLNFSIGTNNQPSNSNICVGFFNGSWHNTSGFAATKFQWYQVVGTYDGSTVKQYVNGSLQSQLSYSGTSQSGGDVRIARRWDSGISNTNFFPCRIGLIKIWNTAIDSTSVTSEYNTYKTRFGI